MQQQQQGTDMCSSSSGPLIDGLAGHSAEHSASLAEAALERVRYQAERCDTFEGCLLMNSLAGGTGAGAILSLAMSCLLTLRPAWYCVLCPLLFSTLLIAPFARMNDSITAQQQQQSFLRPVCGSFPV